MILLQLTYLLCMHNKLLISPIIEIKRGKSNKNCKLIENIVILGKLNKSYVFINVYAEIKGLCKIKCSSRMFQNRNLVFFLFFLDYFFSMNI